MGVRLRRDLSLAMLVVLIFCLRVQRAHCWSNGGYSSDPTDPDYGTHDWIAQHALDWLPDEEKQYLLDNLALFLYGTELPDNWQAPDGIGDTSKHHVYYHVNGSLQDDASAKRAQEEYDRAQNYIQAGDFINATKTLGTMVHYISDVAVFGHVMGSHTDWGAETHHSDYETYVNGRTDNYTDEFNSVLVFDGVLSNLSAYNATLTVAYDTTFDLDGELNCVWMDQNYDWANSTFRTRCGESLNLAVNLVADVLHSFYSKVIIPEFHEALILPIFMTVAVLVALVYRRRIRGSTQSSRPD